MAANNDLKQLQKASQMIKQMIKEAKADAGKFGMQKMSGMRDKLKRLKPKKLTQTMKTGGLKKLAPKVARNLKPTGRLNTDDIKKAKDMLSKRKGK